MQPLSTDQCADLDETIHISATGTVTSIINEPPAFIMHITQFVMGGLSSDDIAIHAELHQNPKWRSPAERLPFLRAVITVWGSLRRFDRITLAANHSTTCVVVDVDDLSYVYNPKRDSAADKVASPQKKKSNLQEKFKAHATRSRKKTPPSPSSSQPSSSQVQLSKRKAHSSEDEIDDRI